MGSIVLHTKLHVPPLRPDVVARPRLQQKLEQGLAQGCKLSLVCAPAGFGKTTLVTAWLENNKRKAAWLSLGEGDNTLLVFLQYLFAAFKKIDPAIGEMARQKLEADLAVTDLLTLLVNDLAEQAQEPAVLVLDDYHCIHNLAVHEAVAFLLNNNPPQIHTIITTRQDPLLPLSRWRAKGQINEIRLSDLRFTQEEAAAFLNHSMALGLSAEDVGVLETRTEGWIAGLQLAAITIQQEKVAGSSRDSSGVGFIQAFAGDNRYVMDYLMDEVLSRQPVEIQSFLMRTSILERMCLELCETVCAPLWQAKQPAASFSSAAAILAYLDRANLFLIPLDQQREWYRYHHLFAQLLQQRLLNEQGKAAIANLHQQAAAWFAEQGLIDDAVAHAAQAGNTDWLADLLESTLRKPAVWSRGEVNRLLGWLNRLPEAVIAARPSLSMQVSRTLHLSGDTRAGIAWLQKGEHSLEGLQESDEKEHLKGIAAANWATFHIIRGDNQQAREAGELALKLLPEHDLLWRTRSMHALAMIYDELGNLEQARVHCEQVIALSQRAGNTFLALSTMGNLSHVLNRLGKLHQAEACCQQALALGKVNGKWIPSASLSMMGLASVHYERNLLEEAEKTVQDAVALAETGGIGLTVNNTNFLSMLCLTRLARGDRAGAIEMLHKLDEVMTMSRRQWMRQQCILEATRAQLALRFGDLPRASAWARSYEQLGPTQFLREAMDIFLAQVYLAEGEIDRSQALLERLLPAAREHGRIYNVMGICILLALLHQQREQTHLARTNLMQAIALAAPEGYLRMFVAEGEPIRDLLKDLRKSNLPGPTLEFIDLLLSAFPSENKEGKEPPANQTLVEPLSERELEVLRYLAGNLTLPEIAQKLFLSPNTLKAHTNTIYTKLDVHSRMQAVNKGRALGLLADI